MLSHSVNVLIFLQKYEALSKKQKLAACFTIATILCTGQSRPGPAYIFWLLAPALKG